MELLKRLRSSADPVEGNEEDEADYTLGLYQSIGEGGSVARTCLILHRLPRIRPLCRTEGHGGIANCLQSCCRVHEAVDTEVCKATGFMDQEQVDPCRSESERKMPSGANDTVLSAGRYWLVHVPLLDLNV